jgi:hypothetical protein
MTLIPPVWPKPPPFEWTDLHEAALLILNKEISSEPEEFEDWLRKRPGAAVIYLVLAEGGAFEAAVMQKVLASPSMPDAGMPSTLSELTDEKGRLPRLSMPIRENPDFDMAYYQRNTLSGVKYAAAHPKLAKVTINDDG